MKTPNAPNPRRRRLPEARRTFKKGGAVTARAGQCPAGFNPFGLQLYQSYMRMQVETRTLAVFKNHTATDAKIIATP